MLDLVTEAKNVTIKKFDTVEGAQRAASQEAAATGGTMLPAIMFRQGQRWMLTTAFLIPLIRTRLQTNHAQRKGGVDEVRAATNRPVMPDHVENVKNYLKANVGRKYILPPLTLNARQPISVYLADFGSTVTAVTIVIPANVRLEITDGGHRKNALDLAADEIPEELLEQFYGDAVSVMITIEDDMAQIHQDFADASKTKALPKSQLAAYDRRNPANGIVLDLIDRCAVFKGKIDSTSTTLSKNSNKLFLTNQVRQLVKELLVGSYAMPDDQFEAKAKEILGSSETPQYTAELERFVAYVDRITQAIPILRQIASNPTEGVASNRISDLRAQGWVCLTATGLVILGRIGHDLFKNETADWEAYADRLGNLDWRRAGSLWEGNIVQGGKMMTQQTPVKGAVAAVRDAIGLPSPEDLLSPEPVAA
ncbi:MAG: DNA sulfur modification protein DndB [Alphaproteobacteria bacterium]